MDVLLWVKLEGVSESGLKVCKTWFFRDLKQSQNVKFSCSPN